MNTEYRMRIDRNIQHKISIDKINKKALHIGTDGVMVRQSGNYNDLTNKPTLNGKVISGDIWDIQYGTTEHWNSQRNLVTEKGMVYVYSDYSKTSDGKSIAGIKIGDGTSYLIDMPFASVDPAPFEQHISNKSIHVSAQDRQKWDQTYEFYENNQNLIINLEG